MGTILIGLNDAQKAAVTSEASVLQVLAPPGSGKTKTLTTRVAHLISERQLKPWNIIVCTFTVKAAREMKERIRGFVGEGLEKKLILGTFHSVALRYLRSYGHHIGLGKDFAIADATDSKAIIRRIIKQSGLSIEPGVASGRISAQKTKGVDSKQFSLSAKHTEQREFSQLYSEYEATLAASKLLDYDDLLLRCQFLLKKYPQCVSNVQAVLIDEFQDTNNIQYDLMALFSQKFNQITIVGDPDQSIYGFRSAEIKNLGRMREQWPDTVTINLEENYRSSGAILYAAQNIIEQDESRPAKKLQATHSHGLRPVLRKLPTAYAEADWIVSEIKRAQALTGCMLQPNDFTVLLRSAALSRPIESAMGRAGVPYRMVGGTKFYDRAEVKILIDYLRVVCQPEHSEAVERIINVPSRKVGDTSIKILQEGARKRGVSLWKQVVDSTKGIGSLSTELSQQAQKGLAQFVGIIISLMRKVETTEQLSLSDLLNTLVRKIGFQDYLKSRYGEDHENRWTNVEELFALASEASNPDMVASMAVEDELPAIDDFQQRTPAEQQDVLGAFLSNIALTAAADKETDGSTEPLQQVLISTIHAAKGLEWPVVFIPACYDGSIPHSRAEDHDEERRLLYVGMTRAQGLLYLSCPVKNSQKTETVTSPFLTETGAAAFFDDHGPGIPRVVTQSLAATLHRNCPSPTAIAESSLHLEREEDNHWPLDGTERNEEMAKWDYGRDVSSTRLQPSDIRPASWTTASAVALTGTANTFTPSMTPNAGFVSAAARYNEEIEKRREEIQMRKIDSRASVVNKHKDPEVKGRKRQIEGQSSIAGFFSKRQRSSNDGIQLSNEKQNTMGGKENYRPLQHLSNIKECQDASTMASKPTSAALHKTRTLPSSRPAKVDNTEFSNHQSYMFLSSSPTSMEEGIESSKHVNQEKKIATGTSAQTGCRPASTFHTTSVERLGVGQARKTLGVRRTMNGWAGRAHK